MINQDIKIDLGQVQETLMLPLWARAREAEKDNPVIYDTYAQEIVQKIDSFLIRESTTTDLVGAL